MSEEPLEQEAPAGPSLLDVLLFAPVDAAFGVLADPRGSASRGKARVETALRQARALGELSLRFGASELRRRTEGSVETARESASAPKAAAKRHAAGPPPNDVIADYDALSASQIVPLLSGLDASERARVADYESSARARQTILQKLTQLGEGDA